MAIVDQMNIIKNVKTHLEHCLALPPLSRDNVPFLSSADDEVTSAQSRQVCIDLP